MADFPTALTSAVDNTTDVLAKHINNLEAKVGIDSSAVTTSHDYKLSGVTGTDKAVSKTGTETLTNKTLTSPTINSGSLATPTITSGVVSTNLDMNASELILDADGDTSITADTENQIDIKINNADDFKFTANTFTALSGSSIATDTIAETTGAAGVTIDSMQIKDGGLQSFYDLRLFAYRNTTVQSITANTDTTVLYNAEDYDGGSDFNTTTGIYTVPSTGVYIISAGAVFDVTAASDYINLWISAGGTTMGIVYLDTNDASDTVLQTTVVRALTAADEVYAVVKNVNNNDSIKTGRGSFLSIQRIA